MDGAALVVADGEKGLTNHALAWIAAESGNFGILRWQLGEFFRIGAQNVEFAHAAFDVDHIVF